jgi:hypothetical protein
MCRSSPDPSGDRLSPLWPSIGPKAAKFLFSGRDRSGLVAQAINEPRHRNEIDQAGDGRRQQPSSGYQLVITPPCTHGARGHKQSCQGRKIGRSLHSRHYGVTLKVRNKQIVAVIARNKGRDHAVTQLKERGDP